MGWFEIGIIDITGNRYGRLVVIERTDIKSGGKYLWKCLCDCQIKLPEGQRKYTFTTKSNLERGASDKRGGTSSCGCFKAENSVIVGKKNRKHNKYDLSGEYGIGYTSKNEKFYFDLEDYDLIKDYCWHMHTDGYIRTCCGIDKINGKRKNKYIMLHQLLSKKYGYGEEPDHINGRTYDNRKENLRESIHEQNMKNCKMYKNNTSGHKGVYYSKREGKWKATINIDKKQTHLGTFSNYEDAVVCRENAERRYYKEFNRAYKDLIIEGEWGYTKLS